MAVLGALTGHRRRADSLVIDGLVAIAFTGVAAVEVKGAELAPDELLAC